MEYRSIKFKIYTRGKRSTQIPENRQGEINSDR